MLTERLFQKFGKTLKNINPFLFLQMKLPFLLGELLVKVEDLYRLVKI